MNDWKSIHWRANLSIDSSTSSYQASQWWQWQITNFINWRNTSQKDINRNDISISLAIWKYQQKSNIVLPYRPFYYWNVYWLWPFVLWNKYLFKLLYCEMYPYHEIKLLIPLYINQCHGNNCTLTYVYGHLFLIKEIIRCIN